MKNVLLVVDGKILPVGEDVFKLVLVAAYQKATDVSMNKDGAITFKDAFFDEFRPFYSQEKITAALSFMERADTLISNTNTNTH